MQQRSPGQRIWRLIGPIIVKMAVAFVVEAVVIFLYAIFVHPETFQAVSSQEELMQDGGADRWCFEICNTD